MNREIKFRGLNKEHNQWLYGYFFKYPNGRNVIYESDSSCWEVYSSSVGQYTGLKDKNDKDIYEGDIIAIKYNGVIDKCICTFEEYAFGLKYLIGDGKSIKEVGAITGFTPFIDCLNIQDFEIVGNIHDNQELIE